ncbi:MAG: fatty acid desaturase CarF family protein [Candidatus Acidiferrales bacterium]
MEGVSIAAFVLLFAVLATRVARAAESWTDFALLSLAVPAGLLLADFLSGCAHWFCDRFFEEKTPVLGPLLIAPFREHHRDPLAMTRHGFLELNGNSALALTPLLAWVWIAAPATLGAMSLFAHALLLSASLALLATNQIHRWAHDAQAPPAVRWLQRHGGILSPEHHQRHHQPPHQLSYCITGGWLNATLDHIEWFARCERMLRCAGAPAAGLPQPPAHHSTRKENA